MAKKIPSTLQAQAPLILRAHRLMDAFAKSDDEREFYLDTLEGFILYLDLDKPTEDVGALQKELEGTDRYLLIPKLTFYSTKKIMEGFVHEKVYDIDIKEKLLDIIQSKNARTNFLEFIYDHHTELDKWQQYYQERSRIRIIEWLRSSQIHFVFEEDLELPKSSLEKIKRTLFDNKVTDEISSLRKLLEAKAKTYYSNEALNPRPKRGRPPKQQVKQEVEPQVTVDLYTQIPPAARPFLFTPEFNSLSDVTFASEFDKELDPRFKQANSLSSADNTLLNLNKRLASLKHLSANWLEDKKGDSPNGAPVAASQKVSIPAAKPVREREVAAPARKPAAPTPAPKLRPATRVAPKAPAKAAASSKKQVAEPPKPGKKRKLIKLTRTKPKQLATRFTPKASPKVAPKAAPKAVNKVAPKAAPKVVTKVTPKKIAPKVAPKVAPKKIAPKTVSKPARKALAKTAPKVAPKTKPKVAPKRHLRPAAKIAPSGKKR